MLTMRPGLVLTPHGYEPGTSGGVNSETLKSIVVPDGSSPVTRSWSCTDLVRVAMGTEALCPPFSFQVSVPERGPPLPPAPVGVPPPLVPLHPAASAAIVKTAPNPIFRRMWTSSCLEILPPGWYSGHPAMAAVT